MMARCWRSATASTRRGGGKGYATEIATALMAHAAAAFGPQPIYAITRPANSASRKVLEKLGMTLLREMEMYGAAQCLYVRNV